MTEPVPHITVVVCTYRRADSLARLLRALDRLRFVGTVPELDVVVLDNSPDDEAAPVVAAAAVDVGYPLRLVPVRAGNISVARNRGLDEISPSAEFVAWLDDDELPEPRWLQALLSTRASTGADFAIGPVNGHVPTSAPAWLRSRRFFDALDDRPDRSSLDEGITGNVLASVPTLRRLGLRFDEGLGHAGGEDQLFFRAAVAAGATLAFAAAAVVLEEVPAERLSLRYLLRREYRKGNSLGLFDRGLPQAPELPRRPIRRLAAAAWWLLSGTALVLRSAADRDRGAAAAGLMRTARAAGMLTGLSGSRFDHYGPARAAGARQQRVVLVLREDPQFQDAGHNRYVRDWAEHLSSRGYEVVLLLVGQRVRRLVRRQRRQPELITPGALRFGPLAVTIHPRLVAVSLLWRALCRLSPSVQAALLRLRARWRSSRGVDHDLGRALPTTTRTWLLAELARLTPDAVLFDTVFTIPVGPATAGPASVLSSLPPSVRAAYVLTHDVLWQRAEAFRAQGYEVSPRGFDVVRETELLAAGVVPIAISERDASSFREMLPSTDVLVVPVPAPRTPVPLGSATGGRTGGPRLLFVGSASLHNVDAIEWFVHEVWPQVRAAVPGATLRVVGSVCGRLAAPGPGVTLLGQVENLTAEYLGATLVIVPMRAGSGMKVKLVEALAHGCPVLSTTVGIQGLETLRPQPFEVADDAESFAAVAVRLLGSESARHALAVAARGSAAELSPQHSFVGFDAHLDTVLATGPEHAELGVLRPAAGAENVAAA